MSTLPGIEVEHHRNGDGSACLLPDRDFWRYLFAGMAMQGALADHQPEPGWAIKQADALLAELEREEGRGKGDG